MPPNTSATGGYLLPVTPPPADDLSLDRQLSNLVSGITGLPGSMVRPRWQPEPPPIPAATENWASVGVTESNPEKGTPYFRHVGRDYDPVTHVELPYDGRSDMVEQEELTVLVTFYGPASGELASLLKSGIHVGQNWEQGHSRGLALKGVGAIRHVPEQINREWYMRRDIELRIMREVDRTYSILNILSAQGTLHGDRLPSTAEPSVDWSTENVNG